MICLNFCYIVFQSPLLTVVTKNIANAKFIFSTNTKIEDDYFTGESQNIQGIQILEKEDPNNYIKLEPLRMEEISELLKTYSLR